MEPSDNLYNEILSGGPSQGTLFLVLLRMKKEGRFDKVMEECAKALEIFPDDIRIRKLLAEAYYAAGMIQEAETEIKTAIAKINDLAGSYRLLADLCVSQGKMEEAIEALKLYLIHSPDDKESFTLLESLAPSSHETAQPPEEPAVIPVVEPELSDIVTPTLAEVYYSQGKTQEAIDTYEKVLGRAPDDSMSRIRLDELKNTLEQARTLKMKQEAITIKKKKMASILDMWLSGIREQSKAGSVQL
jgi:tetratricopeptide (TPR) repeat protein